jgi:hypothetical protein
MRWLDRLEEWWVTILAALLVVGAPFAIWLVHEGFWHSLSEVVFLAAALTLTVDPFLKRRLIKESAKDIFQHLLGIDFPEEIRDAFQTALLRGEMYVKDVSIEADARTVAGNSVVLEVSTRATVVAARDSEYEQSFASEESENANISQASVTFDSRPKVSYSYPNPSHPKLVLKAKADEPMVFEWKGRKIRLRKGDRLSTYMRFTVRRGTRDFFVQNFAVPTIHLRVRIRASNDLEISASAADLINDNEYNYKKVFLPADHIQIRWKPKLPPVATNSKEVPSRAKCDLPTPLPSQGSREGFGEFGSA